MAYSTIKKKTCRVPDCTNYPGFGMAGFCYKHISEEIKQEIKDKRDKARKKANARVADKAKLRKVAREENGGETAQTVWFRLRRLEMTGRCMNCGEKTMKEHEQYYRHSIAHILPKSKCKSVAMHPLNFIELCFFNNSCHTNMDNGMLPMNEMKCWDEIVKRFKAIYPLVADHERQFIPKILLDTL